MLRDNEPAVLLDEGDPESLSQWQREQALRAFVERYGQGGWRGLSVPQIQVHRFASPELADTMTASRNSGHRESKTPMLERFYCISLRPGRIGDCADIAHAVARDEDASLIERMIAIDAMVAIRDPRLKNIASEVATAQSCVAGQDCSGPSCYGCFPEIFQ